MDEGAPGVYSAEVVLASEGVFFARVSVGDAELEVILVRVRSSWDSEADVDVDQSFTLGVVAPAEPSSVQVSMYYHDGSSAGKDSTDVAYVWPQAATPVPSNADCFYFDDVHFDEGGRVQVALEGDAGPVWNDVVVVHQPAQETPSFYAGWAPDAAYAPSDWVSIGYLRRWTGWDVDEVTDAELRELRALAVDTFIDQTGRWYPGWAGTIYGLRGQGDRLYLPMPVLLPQDGGTEPVVKYVTPDAAQDEVETLTADDLIWRVRGRHEKQPYVMRRYQGWSGEYDVKIAATFGSARADGSAGTPLKVKQVIVGLVRWHSLSHGVGPDDSADQATLNRIQSETVRSRGVRYSDRAIGSGLTGDVTVDRALAEMKINPGPWGYRPGEGMR